MRFGFLDMSVLSDLVPGWVKAMYLGTPLARVLRFDPKAEEITISGRAVVAPLSLLDSDMDGPPLAKPVNVDITLPPDHVLRRQISAPLSARATLPAIARLDLQRKTPFQEQDVFWALGPARVEGDQIQADQWVVRRADIEVLRARMRAKGLRLRRLSAPEAGTLADFSAELSQTSKLWQIVNALLLVASLGLAAVWWLYPGWVASQQVQVLTRDQSALQTQAIALRQKVETLHQYQADRAALAAHMFDRPLLSTATTNLTKALPDTVWIDMLSLQSAHLVMSGETRISTADLVETLSALPGFANPRLTGPVSRMPSGAERFEITLDIAPREVSQ